MIPEGKPGERRYGRWAGNPDGTPERPQSCIESLRPDHAFVHQQCSRNRGHGPNGEFCKQHAKRYEDKT